MGVRRVPRRVDPRVGCYLVGDEAMTNLMLWAVIWFAIGCLLTAGFLVIVL